MKLKFVFPIQSIYFFVWWIIIIIWYLWETKYYALQRLMLLQSLLGIIQNQQFNLFNGYKKLLLAFISFESVKM